jgi:NifB/MoaA-like Fe-S oxidoreductase
MNKKSDNEFTQRAKKLFDASVDGIDAATLSTLNQARQRALATQQHAGVLRWVPAAGVAAVTFVAVMVILPGPTDVEVMPTTVTDMEILLGEDSIEMLEDLEFYSWIDVADEGDGVT